MKAESSCDCNFRLRIAYDSIGTNLVGVREGARETERVRKREIDRPNNTYYVESKERNNIHKNLIHQKLMGKFIVLYQFKKF